MLSDSQDAYGHALLDGMSDAAAWEIIERDDGYFDVGPGPELYFSRFEDWPASERAAMNIASGRVVDIGCGAGRHSLHLQERGR